jgi:hypothetical protein
MQTIDSPKIIEIADRAHELQREYRDLTAKLKEIGDELEPLRTSLLRASGGADFQYPSSDGFSKIVEFNIDDSEVDAEAMALKLRSLKYRIPLKQKMMAIVRWATTED